MANVVHLPEGIRASFTVYCTSDETGLEAAIIIAGTMQFQPDNWQPAIEHSLRLFGKAGGVTDARLMTNAEIKDYLARQEED